MRPVAGVSTLLQWALLVLCATSQNTTDSDTCSTEPSYCLLISPDQCYFNPGCCKTCAVYEEQDMPDEMDCRYGDRAHVCHAKLCSNEINWYICCRTCRQQIEAAATTVSAPDTTPSSCNDVTPGCDVAVTQNGNASCYYLETNCCKTCEGVRDHEHPDCPYGDRIADCTLDVDCASSEVRRNCCETCRQMDQTTQEPPECVDDAECESLIRLAGGTHVCYELHDKCCESCTAVKNTQSPDCAYGDKQLWCSGIDRQKCYNFHDTCCDSCKKLASNTTECEYGDRMPRFCQTLLPWECYDYPVACCDTCKHVRNPDAAAQCEFGDKVEAKVCLRHKADGCQSDEAQQKCCRTCASQNMDK